MEQVERYRGALLGLAAGDALGATVEFKVRDKFEPMTDIAGGGPHRLQAGQWTDDTSMALCLAESLIVCQEMDLTDQLERYVRWWREGHWSSKGYCFDIGNATSAALSNFERTGDPHSGSTDPYTAGNGSIMRLAPVPLFFASHPAAAIEKSAESSITTHGAKEAVDACRYLGTLICGAVNGASKDALLSDHFFSPAGDGYWQEVEPLAPKIAEIAAGSFKRKDRPEVKGDFYVVPSLEAALWAFHSTDTFEEGVLAAVNLGDDADTTGAVCVQLAGAFYGASSIPEGWRDKLTFREKIETLADDLFRLARTSKNP
ncbi:ADP-ribosylglycohydrolase family protein [soil metagenome]